MKKERNKLVIAGGTGFVGEAMIKLLTPKFKQVVVLTRRPQVSTLHVTYVQWNGVDGGNWQKEIEHSDLLINLCGKSVDCRYTEANKKAILDSRVQSTLALGAACIAAKAPPKVWMNAASATIYAHEENHPHTELDGRIGSGFSVDVCTAWEGIFNEIPLNQTRKIILRMALVLGNAGGVWPKLRSLTKLGLGGQMGNGNQMISWIHEKDLTKAILFAYENEMEGPVNLSAPAPLSNQEFMKMLRQKTGTKFGLPASNWMLELCAKLIGTETELILKSRYVMPEKLLQSGFKFEFPSLPSAMKMLQT